VDANAANIAAAYERLPPHLRENAPLVFTAHSIPASMAAQYPYERQIAESVDAVASGSRRKVICYQSRSGRPEDPWLGPDICDYLREQAPHGLEAAVLSPIGFVCDHIEVLYDLDVEAAAVARELGMTLERASAVNDHPRFIDTMADTVLQTVERYAAGRPLQLVHA
jgi:ferrochelatase